MSEAPDLIEDHRPTQCRHCGLPFTEDEAGEVIREYDEIDLPEVKPVVRRHRRLSERALRPSVIQRKVTNGYRAKWAADAEVALRSTVDTARLTGQFPFRTILGATSA